MLVAAIENGTVIDHIPADKTFLVANLLGLLELNTPVTIGNNYNSERIGKKGIIKVENKFFTDEEISRLSVVAPNAVLNIIHDYEPGQRHDNLYGPHGRHDGGYGCRYCDPDKERC